MISVPAVNCFFFLNFFFIIAHVLEIAKSYGLPISSHSNFYTSLADTLKDKLLFVTSHENAPTRTHLTPLTTLVLHVCLHVALIKIVGFYVYITC